MAQSYQSIRVILDKVLRHPLMQDITFETAVDYAVDFMRIVGCPNIFTDKVVTLEIKNYRAPLPCDFYEMNQVRGAKSKVCYRYATDSFHLSQRGDYNTDATYKIQGSIIYTSRKEEDIEISYRAIELDDEGLPLIPENSSFTRALELYIKKEAFTILFDTGKIQAGVMSKAESDYAWKVGQLQSEMTIPSESEMEAICRSWTTLIQRTTDFDKGFKHLGNREYIRNH